MQLALSTIVALSLTLAAQGAINDSCELKGVVGSCMSTSACIESGGVHVTDFCVDDPANVQCCTPRDAAPAAEEDVTALACAGRNINAKTIAEIKVSEGFVPNVYKDPVGYPTVGYGHLCKSKGCSEVPYSFPLSEAEGTALLKQDAKTFQNCISTQLKDSVKLNANQYGALISWAYNVGCGNTASSNLIKRLNAGGNPNTVASEELPKWRLAGGVVLPGLVARRKREVALFKTATTAAGHPPSC
ncbi:lysozyme [Coprinopsis sp. MPI-PUGE-AT-0042]|nr:lysozyme [Coprinopsis sp. MPI-PUGE-AT-0042]